MEIQIKNQIVYFSNIRLVRKFVQRAPLGSWHMKGLQLQESSPTPSELLLG